MRILLLQAALTSLFVAQMSTQTSFASTLDLDASRASKLELSAGGIQALLGELKLPKEIVQKKDEPKSVGMLMDLLKGITAQYKIDPTIAKVMKDDQRTEMVRLTCQLASKTCNLYRTEAGQKTGATEIIQLGNQAQLIAALLYAGVVESATTLDLRNLYCFGGDFLGESTSDTCAYMNLEEIQYVDNEYIKEQLIACEALDANGNSKVGIAGRFLTRQINGLPDYTGQINIAIKGEASGSEYLYLNISGAEIGGDPKADWSKSWNDLYARFTDFNHVLSPINPKVLHLATAKNMKKLTLDFAENSYSLEYGKSKFALSCEILNP